MTTPKPTSRPGELARDTKRRGGPRFGGQSWTAAEQRDAAERFGKARNEAPPDVVHDVPEMAEEFRDREEPDDVHIEGGGQHAGIGRGEKPRKPKARTKPNPRAKKTSRRRR